MKMYEKIRFIISLAFVQNLRLKWWIWS
uniref:Uncharacterized protein n=1 Tax=Rhizophora mucronata TaxID=61149 RepID=A0A2P2ISP8_RHIMU